MLDIVDEKRVNSSLSKYKLSNGQIVDTLWVKQNISYIANAKVYSNGRVSWGILTLNTEENRFYVSLCNTYYRLGTNLGIIKEIFFKYEDLYRLPKRSKQEEKFKDNLYSIIQMFFSYMTDTSYVFLKFRHKKVFSSGSKVELIQLRSSIEDGVVCSIDTVFGNVGLTFLGDCLYSIYLFNLCNRLCRHKDDHLQFLNTNESDRKRMLDDYLSSYVKDYKTFQKRVLDKRRFIGRNLDTYSQDVSAVLAKLRGSTSSSSLTYTDKLEECIKHCNMLSELLLGASQSDTDNKSKFISSTLELSNSVALATGNISLRCGTAFVKFFNDLYSNYKKVKLPKDVYDFIDSLNNQLENYEIDILVFLLEQRVYKLSKQKNNRYYYTYNIPYLWIMFDFQTFDKYIMRGAFKTGCRNTIIANTGLGLDETVTLAWLSTYIFVNKLLVKEVDSGSLLSSIFGKVNEDLYVLTRQYFDCLSQIDVSVASKAFEVMYEHCNKDFGYNFKHSDFLTEEEITRLIQG